MLNDLCASFSAVVTPNGKSLDRPLLETRFTCSRVPGIMRNASCMSLL